MSLLRVSGEATAGSSDTIGEQVVVDEVPGATLVVLGDENSGEVGHLQLDLIINHSTPPHHPHAHVAI